MKALRWTLAGLLLAAGILITNYGYSVSKGPLTCSATVTKKRSYVTAKAKAHATRASYTGYYSIFAKVGSGKKYKDSQAKGYQKGLSTKVAEITRRTHRKSDGKATARITGVTRRGYYEIKDKAPKKKP